MEKKVKTVANPTNPQRLELILIEMQKTDTVTVKLDNVDEEGEDEVSQIFYPCSCTIRAKCQTPKCSCYANSSKCSVLCHNGQTKCTNKM